jgi:DNA-binding protein HU-beta
MNKTDFVNQLGEKLEITKKQAGEIFDAVFGVEEGNLGIIAGALSKGEKIQIVGFGNFEVRETAARKGRNPSTGEEIEIPEGKKPAFKAGKGLKEAIK